MAEKYYLDEQGLARLVEYIRQQLIPVAENTAAIELLNKTDGTPGSVQTQIAQALSNLDIAELQQEEPLYVYGGSATDVM